MARQEWRKPKELYPTPIQQLTRCPMRGTIERVISGQNRNFESTAKLAIGKDVHHAIEKSFEFLQDRKTDWLNTAVKNKTAYPGASLVEKSIREAQAIAQNMLSQKQSTSTALPAVNETIKEWGTEYLEHEATDIHIEKDLKSKNFPWVRQIGGKLDMLMVDKERDVLKVIDHKTTAEISALMDSLDPRKGIQPLFYSHLAWNNAESLHVGNPQSVEFIYNLIPADDSGKSTRMLLSHVFNQSDMKKVPSEIAVHLAKASTIEMIAYNKIKAGRAKDGISSAIQSLKTEVSALGGCNPTACSSCPLRFNCTFSRFVQNVIDDTDKIGNKFIDSRLKKYDQALGNLHEEARGETERQYKSFRENRLKEYEKQVTTDITNERLRILETDILPEDEIKDVQGRVKELTSELDDSWKLHHRYDSNKFNYNVQTGAKSAVSRIPFSLLGEGEEYFHRAPWMSYNLRNSINYFSRERIDELSATFNIKPELIEEKVMTSTFTDRKLARELDESITRNIRESLHTAGAKLTEDNIALALQRYDFTLDKPMAQAIFERIDQNTIQTISEMDYERVNHRLSDATARKALTTNNMKEVVSDLQSNGAVSNKLDYYWKKIARRETMTSLSDRYKISPGKFPFRPMAAAAMLTYIAGVFSVRTILSRKVEKMGDWITSDKEIDDGTHSSPRSIVRRTLNSDFGSKRMWVPGGVGETAAVKGMASAAFQKVKKYTTNLLSRFGVSEDSIRSKIKMARSGSLRSLASGKLSPGKLFVGTAISSLLAMAILPNVKTDREIAKDTKDKIKRRKKLKIQIADQHSNMIEPESDLRVAYLSHTPFRSSISFSKLMEKGKWIYNSATEFAKELGIGRISKAQNIGTHSGTRWLQTQVSDKVGQIVSQDIVERPYHRVKKWSENIYDKVVNAVHRDVDSLQRAADRHKDSIQNARNTVTLVKEKADTSTSKLPSMRKEANTLKDKFELGKEKWRQSKASEKLKTIEKYTLIPTGSTTPMPIVPKPSRSPRIIADNINMEEPFVRRNISSANDLTDDYVRNLMRDNASVIPRDVSIGLPKSNIVQHSIALDGGIQNYYKNKHGKYFSRHDSQLSEGNYSKYSDPSYMDSMISSGYNSSKSAQIIMDTSKAQRVGEFANISDHFIPQHNMGNAHQRTTNNTPNNRTYNRRNQERLLSINDMTMELRSQGHTRYGSQRGIQHTRAIA